MSCRQNWSTECEKALKPLNKNIIVTNISRALRFRILAVVIIKSGAPTTTPIA